MLIVLGIFRPGVKTLDRWLVGGCWDLPPLWNAVADVAVESGLVSSFVDEQPAPWRRASIIDDPMCRYAILTFSDMYTSKVYILNENYSLIGALTRTTTDPHLVTQERRGEQPLSHLWPPRDRDGDGVVETMIAFAPTSSGSISTGSFAYVRLRPGTNELLLAFRVKPDRRFHGVSLDHEDLDNDFREEVLVKPVPGKKEAAPLNPEPLLVFRWNPLTGVYEVKIGDETVENHLSYWCPAPGNRLFFRPEESVDELMLRIRWSP